MAKTDTNEGVHVDPDITEGHPGYEESGGSEIRMPKENSTSSPTAGGGNKT